MTISEALLLGIVQGLTEFLPVSSSGHLVIVQSWLGVREPSLTFEVAVHLGTLFAVLWALRREWTGLVLGLLPGRVRRESRRLAGYLVLASIPVALVGLLFRDALQPLFSAPRAAGVMFLATGSILWLAERMYTRQTWGRGRGQEEMGPWDALWIGCGQALAALPGLSRSGATIGAGMMRGFDRQTAARFAFLLAIPAILGASILEIPEVLGAESFDFGPVAAGFSAALIAGYGAISLFLRFLRSSTLKGFSYYTWALGTIVLVVM